MEYPCLVCKLEVRPKQHAVQCDSCQKWQHRLCQSGISLEQYRISRKQGFILWTCQRCSSSSSVAHQVQVLKRPRKNDELGCILHSTGMSSSVTMDVFNESSIVHSSPRMSCSESFLSLPLHSPSDHENTFTHQPEPPRPCASVAAQPHYSHDQCSSPPLPSSLPAHSPHSSPSSSSFSQSSHTHDNHSPVYTSTSSSSGVSVLLPSAIPSSCTSPDVERLTQTSAVSFSVLGSFQESNLQATLDEPGSPFSSEFQEQFVVVPGASKRGKDLLVEGGYTYIKDGTLNKSGQQRWRCSVRNKSLQCCASVLQRGKNFDRGAQPHLCSPSDCALPSAQIRQHVRVEGKERSHASGSTLVKEAIHKFLPLGAPASSMATVSSLVRITNRYRQKSRPKHPKSLEFAWEEDAIPSDFKQADLEVGCARHVVFFTTFLFSLLCSAKTWYVDATFKAVQKPFYQLWSVHAFVKQNDAIKQVPLLFAIMSRRCKADYKAILEFLKAQIPLPPQAVVMDFEAAIWGAFREVFAGTVLRGCCFHWKQSVFRKIKELGLTNQYSKSSRSRHFLLELMSLPFLPAEQIPDTFTALSNLVKPYHDRAFHSLMEYMEETWIHGNTFPPSSWSVFGHSVRTNNDVEGWHHGLNRMIGRRGNENVNVNLYELVDVLHDVCNQVKMECQLISEAKLKKIQRKNYVHFQSKLFDLWAQYEERKLTPAQFLKQVSLLHTPLEDE